MMFHDLDSGIMAAEATLMEQHNEALQTSTMSSSCLYKLRMADGVFADLSSVEQTNRRWSWQSRGRGARTLES